MTAIQPILLLLLALGAVLYFRLLRSGPADRLMVLLLVLTGAVLVVRPEWSTRVAHWLGVGRGTDLVFYFSLCGLGFLLLLLFSKVRNLEAQLTAVARELALRDAQAPRNR